MAGRIDYLERQEYKKDLYQERADKQIKEVKHIMKGIEI